MMAIYVVKVFKYQKYSEETDKNPGTLFKEGNKTQVDLLET